MSNQAKIIKIVSGGQTGADIGALNAAIYCNVPHGGWCPKGRKQEKRKKIPAKYNLTEMASPDYLKRTEANVVDSDATLILTFGELAGGSLRTQEFAKKHNKPCFHIDIEEYSRADTTLFVRKWFEGDMCKPTPPANCVLNVAGNRESGAPGIEKAVMACMVEVMISLNGLSVYPLGGSTEASGDDFEAVEGIEPVPVDSPVKLYHPKTIAEAVEIVIGGLSAEVVEEIKGSTIEEFTTNEHFGLGAYIRNSMIHQNENQLDLYADFQKGMKGGLWNRFVVHPDEVSRIVLEVVQKRIKKGSSL